MIDLDEVKRVRQAYQKRAQDIPFFIDTKSNEDYYSYSHYREILSCICSLIRGIQIKDESIKTLIERANNHMDNIFIIYEKNREKYILLSDNIVSFLDDLLLDLVEKELYESATNVRKFNESFYRDE